MRIICLVLIIVTYIHAFPKPESVSTIRNDKLSLYEDRNTNEAWMERTIIDKCKEVVLKFDELVEEVERKLATLTNENGNVYSKKVQNTRDAIDKYQDVKLTLIKTRNKRMPLVDKTKQTKNGLMDYMKALKGVLDAAEDLVLKP